MLVRRQTSLLCGCLAAACAASASCTIGVEIGRNDEIGRALVLDVPARRRDRLDLLFVVDNTSDMVSRQQRLASGLEHFRDALASVGGELPDLHIGVITPDLGAGTFADLLPGCSIGGDGGRFRSPAECGVDGDYIIDSAGERNYAGDLSETLACLTTVGDGGCDYEQPIEAMKIALTDSPAGFVRPSAMLGVVFISDEDDCSARAESLFDPDEAMLSGDAEWRCFSAGVRCGTGDDVFPPGWQSDCHARENSRHVRGVDDYLEFLDQLKWNASEVVVTAVVGDAELVHVSASGDRPSLDPACVDPSGEDAFPAVRLRQLVRDSLGGRELVFEEPVGSLCAEPSERGILEEPAKRFRSAMGSTCLRGRVVDMDADTPGQQPDCLVTEAFPDREIEIGACDNRFRPTESASFPCYTIEPGNDVCNHEPTRLSLRVVRSTEPDPRGLDAPIDARLRAACVVDERPEAPIE